MSRQSDIQLIEGTQIPWEVTRSPRGFWVGRCESLGLAVQSRTWQHLMEDIGTSIELLFEDLDESGKLEQFLQDKGWIEIRSKERAKSSSAEKPRFDVPFLPMLASLSNDRSEAVLA